MSVDDQIEALRVACDRNGWNLVDVYVEQDVSGQRPLDRRPGLKRAVADVENGRASVLLVAYFDRLVRSLKTQREVMERIEAVPGAVLQALDAGVISGATAIGWMSATQLGMISEFYARQTGEKTAMSKQRNIDNGIPPFPRITVAYERITEGDDKGKLKQSKYAPLVAEACRLRIGGMSYVKLTKWLSEQGVRAEDGHELTPSGVESMLSSKLLIGEIHFGSFKPNTNAIADPVIDRATFRKMHATKVKRGRYAKNERLLSRLGVLVCGTCGARMSYAASSQRSTKTSTTKRYDYYRCGNPLCTKNASISCDVAESFVRDETIRLSQDVVGQASSALEIESARVAVESAKTKLSNAIMTLSDLMDEPASHEVLATLSAQRDAAVARHERLVSLSSPTLSLTTASAWDDLTLDERREIIVAVVDRAVVAAGRGADRITVFGHTIAE